jgi:hypothetical protein
LATTGEEVSKDLKVIKGQLSATQKRLQWLCLEYGEELLTHDSGQEKHSVPMSVHITNLLIKLEIYREHVDNFTSSVRKKYGMPELRVRKDTNNLRMQFMEQMQELQNEIKDMSPKELNHFLEVKFKVPTN